MDGLTKLFNYKKDKDDVDYIVEVIREMAHILIDEDKDFDIVIKLKNKHTLESGCLKSCNDSPRGAITASDTIINRV
jgi:hypothetical protein